jgi:four helix bundle protein
MDLAQDLEERCYQFTLRSLKFCRTLPRTPEGYTIRNQLLRATMGTVGNYRSARRSRSRREFVARLGKAADESTEARLWVRLTVDGEVSDSLEAQYLLDEATELEAILTRSYGTARANLTRAQSRQITKSPNHQITKSTTP